MQTHTAYLSKCLKLPKLTKEEEDEFFARYKNGSQPAFNALVMHNVKLVHHTTFQFRKWRVPHEDMMDVGIVGLITGINKFEPDKGFRISTYVVWYIRRELQRYVGANSTSQIRLDTNGENRQLFFALGYIKSKFGFYDKMNYEQCKKVGDHFGLSPEKISEFEILLEGECSLDQPVVSDDGPNLTLVDTIPGDIGFDIDDRIDKLKFLDLIRQASGVLNEQEKLIIDRFYYNDEPETQVKVAKELNLSKAIIYQSQKRAFAKMREFLLNNDIKKYLLV